MQLNVGHVGAREAHAALRALRASSSRAPISAAGADRAPSRPRPCPRADVNGVYTGECTTYALSGFIRGQGEADAALDRLWAKEVQAATDAKRLI